MGAEVQAVFAGFGGQGTLFAGKVMAYAGLIEGRELSWFPSYGPEMRGGTANCSVTLSDRPIGSPLISRPNMLLAMNQPSFDKFAYNVAAGAAIVYDSGLVAAGGDLRDAHAAGIPATALAEEADLAGLANIVLLGRLWQLSPFCERVTLDAAIEKCVPPRKSALIEKNKRAIEVGIGA